MPVSKTITVNWGATGVAAAIFYRVVDNDRANLVARTNSGVTEYPVGSGCYHAKITTWEPDWSGTIFWDDGTDFVPDDFHAFRLASDGLDWISILAPANIATNFREMMVALWRRFYKKADMTTTALKTYRDDNTTVMTTQVLSDNGTTKTQNSST